MFVASFLSKHGSNISFSHQQALDHSSESLGPIVPYARAPQVSDKLFHIQVERGLGQCQF